MRAEPYMRPAMALAAGGLRSIGIGARLQYSERARMFVRRAKARAKVQQLQRRRKGGVQLSAAEAHAVGREISSRLRYRGERRRRR